MAEMEVFNQSSRTRNLMRIASVSEICAIVNLILGFIYRTVFLSILSVEYLGINGLFTQILSLLSLADLGIANAITFRFYKPIKEGNIIQVGKLMNYFKKVYGIILAAVLAIGLSLCPFLRFFIKDASEIPKDVNLYVIYTLFLVQSASSYLFAYRQALLTADQKQYKISLIQMAGSFFRYSAQMAFLVLTHNFEITIAVNILFTVSTNAVISLYAKKKYAPVFEIRETLNKEERKAILHDTKACMCHKIGGVVLNSTDNIILSKFVGLFSVGLYSNYSMIISNLSLLANQILCNSSASLGNACASLDSDGRYRIYRNMTFLNFWMASSLTICLYVLVNPFIRLWVGESMLLNELTVISLCAQFYFELIRLVNISYTSADGLFVMDIYRPLIEAGINLIVSILLVNAIGIAGVFWGTVISCLSTVTWREPYLIFKYDFKRNAGEYIRTFFLFLILTGGIGFMLKIIIAPLISNFAEWLACAVLTVAVSQILLVLVMRRRYEFVYLKHMVNVVLKKTVKKIFGREI